MKSPTVICHFFNEEYLLPWWLNHHKQLFSDGIMINYHSTDASVDIIRKICPTWTIVNTRNEFFGALELDREIEDYEKFLTGRRIVLNVTEFLVGNFSTLTQTTHDLYVPMASMVDLPEQENTFPDTTQSLTKQRQYGINPFKSLQSGSRLFHSNQNIRYPVGRHFWNTYNTNDFMIVRYKHSPWNEPFIQRKMQIGAKQPKTDLQQGWGLHHQYGKEQLDREKQEYFLMAEDLSSLITQFEYWTY